jgi:uncharacterized alkaline shock family protein YloU
VATRRRCGRSGDDGKLPGKANVVDRDNRLIPVGEKRPGSPRLPNDRITIAPGVLLTVVRLAALRVPGVVRMGNTPGGVNRWLRRTPTERGVQALINEDQTVVIDVYFVADADANLREVSYNVQKQVARDIEENLGMIVGAVNVHIEDVVFGSWDH